MPKRRPTRKSRPLRYEMNDLFGPLVGWLLLAAIAYRAVSWLITGQ